MIDPETERYIQQIFEPLSRKFDLIEEKAEVLNGDRPRAQGGASVTKSDMDPITKLATVTMADKAAGDPPTKAEFDLLVDEVRAIRQALEVIGNAVRYD